MVRGGSRRPVVVGCVALAVGALVAGLVINLRVDRRPDRPSVSVTTGTAAPTMSTPTTNPTTQAPTLPGIPAPPSTNTTTPGASESATSAPTQSSTPPTGTPTSNSPPTPKPPGQNGSPSNLALYAETEFGGQPPIIAAQSVTGRVAAGQTRWRSEVAWRAKGEQKQLRFTKGQRLRFQFTVKLSNVSKNPQAESVIWQLVGRTTQKTWPSPPISISAAGNEFHIGGGSHAPDNTGRLSRDREKYFKPDAPASDDRPYRFDVNVLLGGPSTGRVSVSIDDKPVVDNQPMPAGTWYEAGDYTHEWVYAKNGFYGGSAKPITTAMSATHTNMRLSVTNPDGSTVSYHQ